MRGFSIALNFFFIGGRASVVIFLNRLWQFHPGLLDVSLMCRKGRAHEQKGGTYDLRVTMSVPPRRVVWRGSGP